MDQPEFKKGINFSNSAERICNGAKLTFNYTFTSSSKPITSGIFKTSTKCCTKDCTRDSNRSLASSKFRVKSGTDKGANLPWARHCDARLILKMADIVNRYLTHLHSLSSSDVPQRGLDASNTVVDLRSFCLENVSGKEEGTCTIRVHQSVK